MKVIAQKYRLKLVKEPEGEYKTGYKISSPVRAYEAFKDMLELHQQAEEVFAILTLDIKSNVTGVFEVSRGSISKSLVSPREVFKRAILNNACGIILGHNHPSGDITASDEDIKITEKLMEAGKIIGIKIVDHIIVGDNQYCSLKEEGQI